MSWMYVIWEICADEVFVRLIVTDRLAFNWINHLPPVCWSIFWNRIIVTVPRGWQKRTFYQIIFFCNYDVTAQLKLRRNRWYRGWWHHVLHSILCKHVFICIKDLMLTERPSSIYNLHLNSDRCATQKKSKPLIWISENVIGKFNSLEPSDAIWRQISGSTLAQARLVAWRHQAITWANVDLSLVKSSGNKLLETILLDIPKPSITKCSLKITSLKSHWNLAGANEFRLHMSSTPPYHMMPHVVIRDGSVDYMYGI